MSISTKTHLNFFNLKNNKFKTIILNENKKIFKLGFNLVIEIGKKSINYLFRLFA